MPATFKMLASIVAAPTGNPAAVYAPSRGKTAVIGKIIIASTWPDREREGYHHVTSFRSGTVRHTNPQNHSYFGYPDGVEVDNNRGSREKVFITAQVGATDATGLSHTLARADNTATWAGTYSMFTINAGQTPLFQPTLAPPVERLLEINQGIPLAENEPLTITNGLTDLSAPQYGNYKTNDYTKTYYYYSDLLRDHRARASSVRITVFGQEITP